MTDNDPQPAVDEDDARRIIDDAEGGLEGAELTAPGDQLDDEQLPPSG